MILTLYIFLVILSIALFLVGMIGDVPVFGITGGAFLFLLGTLMVAGSVTYSTGENMTITYTYAPNSTIPSSTSANIADYNVPFSDTTSHTIGVFLAIAGVLGFIVTITDMKNPRGIR